MIRSFMTAPFLLLLIIGWMGCGGPPANNPLLEEARQAYEAAQQDTQIVAYAAVTLDQAAEDLRRSEALWQEEEDQAEVEHYAYLTKQRVRIAEERAKLRAAEKELERAEVMRKEVQLRARTVEAERAEQRARLAQQEALQAKAEAQAALERAETMAERVAELEAELTTRGLVLTLGDVLFDVGRSTLRSGGLRAAEQLADFLKEYPERNVLIEGHTDNTGSDALNLTLSRQRADAVRRALIEQGVAADRIHTRGYGEAFPIASNSTAAGRQQNRRVEVIVSDQDGVFPTMRDDRSGTNVPFEEQPTPPRVDTVQNTVEADEDTIPAQVVEPTASSATDRADTGPDAPDSAVTAPPRSALPLEEPPADSSSGSTPAQTGPLGSMLQSREGVVWARGGYTWVVATSLNQFAAETLAQQYRRAGYRVGVWTDETGLGTKAYRVVLGQFATEAQALEVRARVEQETENQIWLLQIPSAPEE